MTAPFDLPHIPAGLAWRPPEVAMAFFKQTRPLDDRQRAWLRARVVPEAAVAFDPGRDTAEIRAARVHFEGRIFDFAEPGDEKVRGAFVVIARNEFGECDDLVAFDLKGSIAPWLGRAVMLGEQMQWWPRIASPALSVFPDALAWLRAERRGVVILDAKRARWRLAQENLVVDDPAFGRRLRAELRLPEPRFFVSKPARRAA